MSPSSSSTTIVTISSSSRSRLLSSSSSFSSLRLCCIAIAAIALITMSLDASTQEEIQKSFDFLSSLEETISSSSSSSGVQDRRTGVDHGDDRIFEDVDGDGIEVQTFASIPVMKRLSGRDTFWPEVERLYLKYGTEIAEFRKYMKKWCRWHTSCKFTDYEAEMLYMLVREYRPSRVFEMAPNKGYSTHWILEALHRNDGTSTLNSYDIHPYSVRRMTRKYRERWNFTLGDYEELYDSGRLVKDDYDFIFIDALHTVEFSRGYCRRLLEPHKRRSIVAIHDIVAKSGGSGRESSSVYEYLANSDNAHHVFTMSRHAMPNLLYPQPNATIPKLNRLRADLGIVPPCDMETTCRDVLHAPLYFPNGDAPTIFFQLN